MYNLRIQRGRYATNSWTIEKGSNCFIGEPK